MKIIKAFKCNFCRRIYMRKSYCLKHEKQCTHNPANTPACNTCPHFDPHFSEDEKENITFIEHFGEDIIFHHIKFSPHRCCLTGKKLFYNHKLTEEVLEALDENNYEPMPFLHCPLLNKATTNENNTL